MHCNNNLKEPVYFKINLNGENIADIDIINRFTQTNSFGNSISIHHSFAHIMAIEKIAKIKITKKTEYLRIITYEIDRISSHISNLDTSAQLINFHYIIDRTTEIKEIIQSIKKNLWGNKMGFNTNILGGIKYDLNYRKKSYILKNLEKLRHKTDEIIDIYENHKIIKIKIKGIGVLSKKDAIKLGITGPVARGSDIDNDIRSITSYSAYDELKPKIILKKEGDVHARIMVRWEEISESAKLIQKAIEELPIEKTTIQQYSSIPAGESMIRVETPKGELTYYLKTGSSKKYFITKCKIPTYTNLEALKMITCGNKLKNLPLIINSLDPYPH